MRRAAFDAITPTILSWYPNARVTRIFDGPNAYVALVLHEDGRRAEVRTKSDLKKISPKKRRKG